MPRGYIIGGFASWKYYYSPLVLLLKRRNISTELLHPGPCGLNIWPLSVFESEVKKVLQKHDEKIFLIGHSLGGIQAVWTASMAPDRIEKIFTIGSPLFGSPWPVYEDGILTLLGASKEAFNRFREETVPSFSSKIITISCPKDVMAPVERCVVPGAKNYVVDTGDDFVSTSHLVIPYLSTSLTIIQNELAQGS